MEPLEVATREAAGTRSSEHCGWMADNEWTVFDRLALMEQVLRCGH